MPDTEFDLVPLDPNPNADRFSMPTKRPGASVAWECSADYCRTVVEIDNTAGTKPVIPGTVLINPDKTFRGVLFGVAVPPGFKELRTVSVRGPSILWKDQLTFPVLTDAADGPDVGADNAAENAAATAALEAALRTQMTAAGILIQ